MLASGAVLSHAWNVPTRSETTTPVMTSLGLGHTGRAGQMDLCPERHIPPQEGSGPGSIGGPLSQCACSSLWAGLGSASSPGVASLVSPSPLGERLFWTPKARQQGALLLSVASPRHSLPSEGEASAVLPASRPGLFLS